MELLSTLSMVHPEPSHIHTSIIPNISCCQVCSSDSISLVLVMVLALLLKYAVLCINSRFPVFESKVFFSKVTSIVIMNLNPFIVFDKSLTCDLTTSFVFVKWFIGSKLS